MHTLLQQLLIGLANGTVFALIALGYSLVYSVLELINFAHGDVFMLSAFFALSLLMALDVHGLHGPALLGGATCVGLLTAIFGAGVAWSTDRFIFRHVRNLHALAPLVSAIGCSFVLQNIGLLWGGLPIQAMGGGQSAAAPKAFIMLLGSKSVLGDDAFVTLSARDIMVFVVGISVFFVTWFVVHKTSLGRAMRATAQDPYAASLMGIDTQNIIAKTFAMGGGLAGIAAMVFGLYIGTVHYQMGYQNGLYAFLAAVLGGIGSISGAMLGGLLLGVMRALSDQYLGTQWQAAVLFGLLIVALIFLPNGLLGKASRPS